MALEPYYEYIVQIETVEGTTVSVNCLANTTYHARQVIIKKFMHMQPDQSKYSMGVKALASKHGLHALN